MLLGRHEALTGMIYQRMVSGEEEAVAEEIAVKWGIVAEVVVVAEGAVVVVNACGIMYKSAGTTVFGVGPQSTRFKIVTRSAQTSNSCD